MAYSCLLGPPYVNTKEPKPPAWRPSPAAAGGEGVPAPAAAGADEGVPALAAAGAGDGGSDDDDDGGSDDDEEPTPSHGFFCPMSATGTPPKLRPRLPPTIVPSPFGLLPFIITLTLHYTTFGVDMLQKGGKESMEHDGE